MVVGGEYMTGSGNVGEIRVGLSLDSINFSQGLKDVNSRISALNSEFKAISTGTDKFESSLDSLRAKADVLTRTLDTHKAKVEELKRQYDESAQANGENAAETVRLARSYNAAVAAMNRVENQLNGINSEIDDQSDKWKQLSNRVGEAGEALSNAGQKMQGIGTTLSASITAPLAGFATLAGKAALDFDAAAGVIQAEIGTTGASAEKLQQTAQNLWKDGFGDSMEGVAVKVAGVSKVLGDLSKVDLSNVTRGLDLFEKRGWADQQEALRAVNVLMKQFGMTASEAMDYLTKGFQENLNFSGEFLDTISEYSTYFSELGFSADDMFAKLKSGAESGAFQLDKVGDAMKEFSLRTKDGSKTSTAAFEALGLNAMEMTDQFNKGGEIAKKAFETVVKALQNTKDETTRNSVAVGLFGTQYEDLGESAFNALLQASQGLDNVEGATKRASDALNNNFGARAKTIWRDFLTDIQPVGDALLDVADNVLPKVADVASKVTGAFADMSPAGQNVVLAIGGISAAAGPVILAIGTMATGISAVASAVAPLLPALGAGTGLAAVISALTGPIGLTVAGLGLATAGFFAYKDAVEKSKEVNLEHTETLIKQQQDLEGLAGKFESLSSKNQLSNDELLRFRDIQSELELGGTAEQIQALTDEQAQLQEKSGLTNDEMAEMLGLNDQLIEKVPDVTTSLSEHGNAIISNADAIGVANEKLREMISLELENQRIKAEAQLDGNIRDYIDAVSEMVEKEKERNEAIRERGQIEATIDDLKLQKQNELNAGQEAAAQMTQDEITRQEHLLRGQNDKIAKLADEVSEKQKSVQKTEEEINKTAALYDKLVNLHLKSVGINEEGAKGIAQLDEAINKTQSRIGELNNVKNAQGGLNAEQQKELDNLQQSLGKYKETKGEIQNIQTEQSGVNQKIKDGTKEADKLTKELDKDVKKDVDVDDKGKAKEITKEAEKPVTKNVILNFIKNGLDAAVKALIPGFASGTRNAPGGLSLVGENGPEFVHLPKGARVIPNGDTEALLRKWNVPMMATGGVTLTAGMAYVGEQGRELVDFRGSSTTALTSGGATNNYGDVYFTINPSNMKEWNMVRDFFNKLKQTTRARG